MLLSEFIERTNFYPTYDEYRAIEIMYYDYPKEKDKDDFCNDFKKHKTMLQKAREIACASFAKEREKLESELNNAKSEIRKVKESLNRNHESEIAHKNHEIFNLRKELKQEKNNWQSMFTLKNITLNENKELRNKLTQALKDVESLKNALRLLKQ